MPNEPEAIAPPVTPTVAVTAPAAPAASSVPERVQAAVSEDFLKNLSKADLKTLNKSIHAVIPRDKQGKALVSAETDPAILATEMDEPAPVPEAISTPKSDPEPEPEPTVTTEPTPDVVSPEPELETEPTDGKLPQHRIRARDSFDDLVMRRYNNGIRDGNPISMEACITAEKAAQGILAPAKADPAAPTNKPLETAQAELAALRQERKTAKAAYDVDAEDAAQTAIEGKLLEIERIERDSERATLQKQQSEQHQRQSAWQAHESQAVTLYPQVIPDKVKGLSEEGKRLIAAKDRLFEEHKSSRDPIRFRVDYPLLLLKLAAAEEGIAPSTVKPKAPAIAAPKAASARSVTPAKPAAPLASASARTTPNGTGKPTAAELLPSLNLRDAKKVNQHFSSLLRR